MRLFNQICFVTTNTSMEYNAAAGEIEDGVENRTNTVIVIVLRIENVVDRDLTHKRGCR